MHIKYFVYANVRTKYDVIARHAITLLVTIILNLSNTYCLNFFFCTCKTQFAILFLKKFLFVFQISNFIFIFSNSFRNSANKNIFVNRLVRKVRWTIFCQNLTNYLRKHKGKKGRLTKFIRI